MAKNLTCGRCPKRTLAGKRLRWREDGHPAATAGSAARGLERQRRLAVADQVALGDQRAADPAVDGGADLGVAQGQLGAAQRRLGLLELGQGGVAFYAGSLRPAVRRRHEH